MRLLVSQIGIFVVLSTSSVLSRSMSELQPSDMELTKTTKGTRVMAELLVTAEKYLVKDLPLPKRDLTGMRFGRLHVNGFAGRDRRRPRKPEIMWDCTCDCGLRVACRGATLGNGDATSCGCKRSRPAFIPERHGNCDSSEYSSWKAMIQRCTNSNSATYKRYGARGVKVCEQWIGSFKTFLKNVGKKPTPHHTLDRFPNKKGNYEPGNVRWATRKEQSQNIATNVEVTINGETMCMSEAASRNNINKSTLRGRLKVGLPIEEAISKPLPQKLPIPDGFNSIEEAAKSAGLNRKTVAQRIKRGWLISDVLLPKRQS